MSTSTSRTPFKSQKNVGGDLSMFFFARSGTPTTYGASDPLQMIKNLNVETVANVPFPPPTWITNPLYDVLLAPDSDSARFSLNMAVYTQTLIPSDWHDKWFYMYGRVHPYALTWEIEPNSNFNPTGDLKNYIVPILMIRDEYHQP